MTNEVRLKILCKNYGFEAEEDVKSIIQSAFPKRIFSKPKADGLQITMLISALYVAYVYLATNNLMEVIDWAWEK